MTAPGSTEVAWHDIECGRYRADLPLWRELAAKIEGPLLELGCGTGRVALELAGGGAAVTGLDRSPALIEALEQRAAERGLAIDGVVGEVRGFSLGRRYGAVLAPMQLVHLLGGPVGRRAMLESVVGHLRPGGSFAAALLAADLSGSGDDAPPLPDVAEHDGWVFSSLPVEVLAVGGGFEVRRLRQIVAPSGELREEVDSIRLEVLDIGDFEAEAEAAGLEPRERIQIAATVDHVGSTLCVMEARR
jgi:SAM-dependent methyltransferase